MKVIQALILLAVLCGCRPASVPLPQPSPAPTQAATPSLLPAASPSPSIPPPVTLWISPDLPQSLENSFHLPPGLRQVDDSASASLRVEPGGVPTLAEWVYVLAAPFPTFTDATSLAALRELWSKGTPIQDEGTSLLVEKSTQVWLEGLWGKPSAAVRVLPAASLLETAWKERTSWTILPFEQLEPRWKVLGVDGQSPIHSDFQADSYPLLLKVGIHGRTDLVADLLANSPALFPSSSNRNADHLTTLILTGTTSLVRATAALMEQYGMDYPAKDIGPLLRGADILHISNEVSFAVNCPAPLPHSGLLFCSQDRYIQLLEGIHPAVIDLSGDHLNDWGSEALRHTIDLYHARGWQTYGGGATLAEGQKPALFEHNGNKIALIGCNYKQPGYAQASPTNPGAVHCDPVWLDPAIRQLKAQGYLPVVTLQDDEYMEAIARPKPIEDFGGAVNAGAMLVSGTGSHQPQAMAFQDGVFIHYGLGNLFFDQIHSWETTDQAFIDRHVIYEEKIISTELITTIFVDFARPRLMTPVERRKLLALIFKASGW